MRGPLPPFPPHHAFPRHRHAELGRQCPKLPPRRSLARWAIALLGPVVAVADPGGVVQPGPTEPSSVAPIGRGDDPSRGPVAAPGRHPRVVRFARGAKLAVA